ncbi:hypothetical protein IOC57_22940 [Bacillus sp. SD075]|uniref:hypothetical protein n=1 Tax=Bacillus sp. SD075 TaxID=2781732 RepID=UPI001A9621B0|nr:hypothetical protein [Bacillus sp. SD075]MBO1000587.1 hypothetical protein [Bacillus sp. SD075]
MIKQKRLLGRPGRPSQVIDARDLEMIGKNMTRTYKAVGPDYTLTKGQSLVVCKKVTRSKADFTWISEKFLNGNKVEPWGEMPLWITEGLPLPGAKKPLNGFFAVDNDKAINAGLAFRPPFRNYRSYMELEKGPSRICR